MEGRRKSSRLSKLREESDSSSQELRIIDSSQKSREKRKNSSGSKYVVIDLVDEDEKTNREEKRQRSRTSNSNNQTEENEFETFFQKQLERVQDSNKAKSSSTASKGQSEPKRKSSANNDSFESLFFDDLEFGSQKADRQYSPEHRYEIEDSYKKGDILIIRCNDEKGFWLGRLEADIHSLKKLKKKSIVITWLEEFSDLIYRIDQEDNIDAPTIIGSAKLKLINNNYHLTENELKRIIRKVKDDKIPIENDSDEVKELKKRKNKSSSVSTISPPISPAKKKKTTSSDLDFLNFPIEPLKSQQTFFFFHQIMNFKI